MLISVSGMFICRYWLYAAVSCKCLLVTNDEMRDHLFQLLGTSFFPRWKEKHQVFSLSICNSLIIYYVLYFSVNFMTLALHAFMWLLISVSGILIFEYVHISYNNKSSIRETLHLFSILRLYCMSIVYFEEQSHRLTWKKEWNNFCFLNNCRFGYLWQEKVLCLTCLPHILLLFRWEIG